VADDRRTEVETRLAARRASTLTEIDELTRSLDDIIDAARLGVEDEVANRRTPRRPPVAFAASRIRFVISTWQPSTCVTGRSAANATRRSIVDRNWA
jgi:hypothetical protein